jgi:glycine/D-amino acid oxidase-like deaminating enzyme
MADVHRRGRGRSWQLRQQSLQLFQCWQSVLLRAGYPLEIHRGLVLLAADGEEWQQQQHLLRERQARGTELSLIQPEQLASQVAAAELPPLPQHPFGALWSPRDGQLDPGQWLNALQADASNHGMKPLYARVEAIASAATEASWQLQLNDGSRIQADRVLLCAGLAVTPLLGQLGIDCPLQPVWGQAMELQLTNEFPLWRNAVVWQGMNLIPRPNGRLWLGATLEPGQGPNHQALWDLRNLNSCAPAWLQRAELVDHWYGARARPVGQPAPLLAEPLPGLLLLGGHYRNGILLGPVSAAWAAARINPAAEAATAEASFADP